MRILWITGNGGKYQSQAIKGTGGWIGAMQDALCEAQPDLELGISFFHLTDDKNIQDGNVTYLPVKYHYGGTVLEKLYVRHFRNEDAFRKERIQAMVKKIREYKPDLIHIWGVEHFYASVLEYIHDVPVVVHIQGLLSTYIKKYAPPCVSIEDIRESDSWFSRVILKNGDWEKFLLNKKRAENEIRCSKLVKNWIGRTEWDKAMSQMLSPGSRYFHGEELMRDEFDGSNWQYHYDGQTINIMSTISCDWYKGIDVVLETAAILKQQGVNICWSIYGWDRKEKLLEFFIKRLRIAPEEVNIILRGRVNGNTIKQGLLSCDCYVHPAYVENSSNAIAEAQMLGVPVIAQYVGGNPSMLRDGSGLLVAPNEPYLMASAIMQMRDKCIVEELSANALNVARLRQNKDRTISNLLDIYKQLIKEGE